MKHVRQQGGAVVSESTIRMTTRGDAAGIYRLVQDSGVLDMNSCYAYLLLCHDFADTCRVAEADGEIVGFVTAYRPPRRPESVFVWQVAVAASARRQGLGRRLLRDVLTGDACRDVEYLEATVSPSNAASRHLFTSFAKEMKAELSILPGFHSHDFSDEHHEDEELFRIGPLRR